MKLAPSLQEVNSMCRAHPTVLCDMQIDTAVKYNNHYTKVM